MKQVFHDQTLPLGSSTKYLSSRENRQVINKCNPACGYGIGILIDHASPIKIPALRYALERVSPNLDLHVLSPTSAL